MSTTLLLRERGSHKRGCLRAGVEALAMRRNRTDSQKGLPLLGEGGDDRARGSRQRESFSAQLASRGAQCCPGSDTVGAFRWTLSKQLGESANPKRQIGAVPPFETHLYLFSNPFGQY